jgi:hypothetical protein
MANPRYDPVENKSRHGAASRKDCEKMAALNDWRLLDVELIDFDIFKVDCVFKGKTEFPKIDKES